VSAAVDTALRNKILTTPSIATLAPGGVHNSMRPQGSLFPVVVFQLVSDLGGAQSFADGGVERLSYDVRVIAPLAQQATTGALVEAIHAVLERGALTISGRTHLQTLRQRRLPMMMQESGGVVYATRGATYEVTLTA
jgi:hypothetical protein